MATPLVINVVELLRWPGATKDVSVTVQSSDVEFNDARVADEPVQIHVKCESLSNGIAVVGTVSATWVGECRRCLAPLRERMTVHVDELYQQVAEDPDAYLIQNDQISLLPMVRENLLVAIPLGPLCREECPGFCPQCGTDLAEGPCGCDTTVSDPRWAALEGLKGKLDDPSL